MKLNKKLILLASAATLAFSAVSLPTYADDKSYTVTDEKYLDADTYKGFKLFRNWCARCHAKYGMGNDDGGLGSNLLESVKTISKEEFFSTVENGKAGQIGSMPAWKANAKVMEDRELIYSYLQARSDGAIGNIKPKKAK
ncbi:MAG: cytochrome C [Methylophaga sp.]|nr:MAG: cytochrome C [Methylophaga sp.]